MERVNGTSVPPVDMMNEANSERNFEKKKKNERENVVRAMQCSLEQTARVIKLNESC